MNVKEMLNTTECHIATIITSVVVVVAVAVAAAALEKTCAR